MSKFLQKKGVASKVLITSQETLLKLILKSISKFQKASELWNWEICPEIMLSCFSSLWPLTVLKVFDFGFKPLGSYKYIKRNISVDN